MKKFLLIILIVLITTVSLPRLYATTNTNFLISRIDLTNTIRQAVDPNQFNTNVWPLELTNALGIYNLTQFTTNGGIASIAGGVLITNPVFVGTAIGLYAPCPAIIPTNNVTIGAGAGAGAAWKLDNSANDNGFVFTLITGTAPASNSPIFTINYVSNYTTTSHIGIAYCNSNASSLYGGSQVMLNSTSIVNIILSSGVIPLTNFAPYVWSFSITR